MVLSELAIPILTSICMCSSLFIINNHCIKRRKADNEYQRKYVVLSEEAYNSISQRQPLLQEYPQYELNATRGEEPVPSIPISTTQPPPNYNEIDQVQMQMK